MAKGRKTGGRARGTPNRVTSTAREAWTVTFENLKPDLEGWIRETAQGQLVPLTVKGVPVLKDGEPVMVRIGADPGKAADLVLRLAEFHTPKLGRQELVGEGGGPVAITTIQRTIVDPAAKT